jgi:hypothetical protein
MMKIEDTGKKERNKVMRKRVKIQLGGGEEDEN